MWRPLGLYLKCTDTLFCDTYPANANKWKVNIEEVSNIVLLTRRKLTFLID
jgi:hypothetical protein